MVHHELSSGAMLIANDSQIHAVEDAHFKLLELPRERSELSQRQMATKLVLTLGKTHYSVKALIASGGVKTQRFVNSERKSGYIYVLTPAGIAQRLQLASTLLECKRREFGDWKLRLLSSRIGSSSAIDNI